MKFYLLAEETEGDTGSPVSPNELLVRFKVKNGKVKRNLFGDEEPQSVKLRHFESSNFYFGT